MIDPGMLRARLLALRADALAQLAEAEGVDSGLLLVVAHASATLAALDEAEAAESAAVQPR